jgi:DNA-binding NarL/FixJ family response regulator
VEDFGTAFAGAATVAAWRTETDPESTRGGRHSLGLAKRRAVESVAARVSVALDLLARVVADGGALIAPQVTRRLIAEFAARPGVGRPNRWVTERLTERETEVLVQVARGQTNAEIADRLVLSPLTVKTHVSRILTKLGLRDRAQLVVAAYESGLVVPGSEPADGH